MRRNALDLPDNMINHRSMLERLIKELVKEESEKSNQHTEKVVTDQESQREAARLLREQRKAEALQRSKERQSNPEYFAQKKLEQERAIQEKKIAQSLDGENNVEELTSEVENDDKESSSDPFSIIGKPIRNKIFVK